jgi:hypothetical protein
MTTRRTGKKTDIPDTKTTKMPLILLNKIAEASCQAIGLTKKTTRPSETTEKMSQEELYGERGDKQKPSV